MTISDTGALAFWKYEALGNDYLVLEPAEGGGEPSPELVAELCRRHRGLGADGVLVVPALRDAEPTPVTIFNSDGSVAEKSGNGLRIAALHLWRHGGRPAGDFEIDTAGGLVRCRVEDEGERIRVAMGRATFEPAEIPAAAHLAPPGAGRLTLAGAGPGGEELVLPCVAVGLGNPHCVLFREHLDEAEVRALGPRIERHEDFPRRTNVQFARVVAPDRLELQIWERGSGYTLASGSSSCAAVAAGHRLGFLDRRVTVVMPGGLLELSVGDELTMTLVGPARAVARGEVDPSFLGRLRGSQAID